MARVVDRSEDPGESEFGGDPDRIGIVPSTPASPVAALLDAYWTDPNDPGSSPDPEGSHIGDDAARNTSEGQPRKNQFRTNVPPVWPKKYSR